MADSLTLLKDFDIENSSVTVWTYKKHQYHNAATPVFVGRWVGTTTLLEDALRAAIGNVRDRLTEVIEYSTLAQNNESSALTITLDETHAGLIVSQSHDEIESKKVNKLKDISNTGFYVIKFVSGENIIYAVRKTDESWKTKKSTISVLFSDNELTLESSPAFSLSNYVDFFIVSEDIVIINKLHFESILSYKQAHIENFTALRNEQDFSDLFANTAPIAAYVGTAFSKTKCNTFSCKVPPWRKSTNI